MAYFAQIDNGIVVNIIRIENDVIGEKSVSFPETEPIGQTFIADVLRLDGEWRQTSYNASFRYNYAGIGFTFDPALGEHGAFIAPQPFPSWTLDDGMKWQPPVPYPTDGNVYVWNEDAQEWQAPAE